MKINNIIFENFPPGNTSVDNLLFQMMVLVRVENSPPATEMDDEVKEKLKVKGLIHRCFYFTSLTFDEINKQSGIHFKKCNH